MKVQIVPELPTPRGIAILLKAAEIQTVFSALVSTRDYNNNDMIRELCAAMHDVLLKNREDIERAGRSE